MLSGLEVGWIPRHCVVVGSVPDIESPSGKAILVNGGRSLAQETHALDRRLRIIEPHPEVLLRATDVVGIVNRQPAVWLETVGDSVHRTLVRCGDEQIVAVGLMR